MLNLNVAQFNAPTPRCYVYANRRMLKHRRLIYYMCCLTQQVSAHISHSVYLLFKVIAILRNELFNLCPPDRTLSCGGTKCLAFLTRQ